MGDFSMFIEKIQKKFPKQTMFNIINTDLQLYDLGIPRELSYLISIINGEQTPNLTDN
jgi:hypothetical protein